MMIARDSSFRSFFFFSLSFLFNAISLFEPPAIDSDRDRWMRGVSQSGKRDDDAGSMRVS